jgi:flagellum-specific ATP synthase
VPIDLDRSLAERGHYPAINVGRSVSRIANEVTDPEHQKAARKLRAILATHSEAQDLIRIGAYARGSSKEIDRAVELLPAMETFLRQDVDHHSTFQQTREAMLKIASHWTF